MGQFYGTILWLGILCVSPGPCFSLHLGGSRGKEPACQCGRHKRPELGPCVGKVSWEGHGNPFQYSCLENPMDRGPWQAMAWSIVSQRVRHHWSNLASKQDKITQWPCFVSFYHGLGFPGGSGVKNLSANAGDWGLVPRLGRSPREGNVNPLQYSCLENLMDGEAWQSTVHGVKKNWIQLRN